MGSTFSRCAIALFLVAAPLPVAAQGRAIGYAIALDERAPMLASFALALPARAEEVLRAEPATEALLVSPPACGSQPLRRVAAGVWIKPAGCLHVTWSARLADHDVSGIDATLPVGMWSARRRFWLLTGRLPWLRAEDQPRADARLTARMAGGRHVSRSYAVTPGRGAPLALVLAAGPVRRYRQPGLEIRVQGEVPRFDAFDAYQRDVALTWLRWRRDILPAGAIAPASLDVVWVRPQPGGETGFFASTNSDAIVMQFNPDPAETDPDARMRAGLMLVGAHEGFHAFLGAFGASRPNWVNESWATFFAYDAARRHLTGRALALVQELIDMPGAESLLEAQRRWDAGDQSLSMLFYGKGVRFWAAIEAVLTGPGNETGRLAALIQASDGMRGVDWMDAGQVAAFLDAHSGGRAGPIVRCYLEAIGCP